MAAVFGEAARAALEPQRSRHRGVRGGPPLPAGESSLPTAAECLPSAAVGSEAASLVELSQVKGEKGV